MNPASTIGKLARRDVLGLDIATRCGYYSLHSSGAWDFHANKSRQTYLTFYRTLKEYIQVHGIRKLVVEDLNVNNHFSDLRKLAQLHGIMLLVSEELALLPVEYVNVSTLKRWATGNGRADKSEMIAACVNNYRFYPKTSDEADAFLLFHFYCRKWRIP